MSSIRPFRAGDEAALAEICVRTADLGADATGQLTDDDIWPAIWAWPYARHDPQLCFVVAGDDDRARGYVVGTADSDTLAG